jgi:hypothetical protein
MPLCLLLDCAAKVTVWSDTVGRDPVTAMEIGLAINETLAWRMVMWRETELFVQRKLFLCDFTVF